MVIPETKEFKQTIHLYSTLYLIQPVVSTPEFFQTMSVIAHTLGHHKLERLLKRAEKDFENFLETIRLIHERTKPKSQPKYAV